MIASRGRKRNGPRAPAPPLIPFARSHERLQGSGVGDPRLGAARPRPRGAGPRLRRGGRMVAPAGGRGIRLAGPSAPRSLPPWSARLGHEPSAVRGAVDPERRMNHGGRRSQPRWRDCDRHVLVALRRALDRVLTRPEVLRAGGRVIDVGAGEAPYRALFEARGGEYIGCDSGG